VCVCVYVRAQRLTYLLDIRRQQQAPCRNRDHGVVPLQHFELLLRDTRRVVGNQMAKLAEHIRTDLDHGLVTRGVEQGFEACASGVVLHLGAADHDLKHTVPHLLCHVVSCDLDEREDDVDVPVAEREEEKIKIRREKTSEKRERRM
jgi:hypothetical protein